jgi:hypothetical protein
MRWDKSEKNIAIDEGLVLRYRGNTTATPTMICHQSLIKYLSPTHSWLLGEDTFSRLPRGSKFYTNASVTCAQKHRGSFLSHKCISKIPPPYSLHARADQGVQPWARAGILRTRKKPLQCCNRKDAEQRAEVRWQGPIWGRLAWGYCAGELATFQPCKSNIET